MAQGSFWGHGSAHYLDLGDNFTVIDRSKHVKLYVSNMSSFWYASYTSTVKSVKKPKPVPAQCHVPWPYLRCPRTGSG